MFLCFFVNFVCWKSAARGGVVGFGLVVCWMGYVRFGVGASTEKDG